MFEQRQHIESVGVHAILVTDVSDLFLTVIALPRGRRVNSRRSMYIFAELRMVFHQGSPLTRTV